MYIPRTLLLILKTSFHIFLVVIYVTLTVKPLKNFMYFWVPSIACPKLTSLYINNTNHEFIPVVQKRILDIMLPIRISLPREFILVESLVYFSILHPRFASLFQLSLFSILRDYILASGVNFSRVSYLFFDPTPSHWKSILIHSLVYFSSLHPCFASIFQSSQTKLESTCRKRHSQP